MPAKRKLYVAAGQRFGRGVVIDPEVKAGIRRAKPNGERGARLRCDCGAEYEATLSSLTGALVQSCGCQRREWARELASRYGRQIGQPAAAAASITHGLGSHPLYSTWTMMLRRCDNPADKRYHRYGGRGITVCDRWLNVTDFVLDIERDLGPRPDGMTLDRINNNGNYEPGNVRWATASVQAANKAKRAPRPDQPPLDVLRAWPPTVSLARANMALGISNTHGHRLAHRGEYPVPLLGAAPPWTVRTADLISARITKKG